MGSLSLQDRRAVYAECNKAIKSGVLTRPRKCEGCGKIKKVIGHHPDYNMPLIVVWLCTKCHGIAHSSGGAGRGKGRAVYFEDELWIAAQKFARSKGLSVSTWIRGLMAAAMKEK